MDERWHGNLFQVSETTDENDLDLAMQFFVRECILTFDIAGNLCKRIKCLKTQSHIFISLCWNNVRMMLSEMFHSPCLINTYIYQTVEIGWPFRTSRWMWWAILNVILWWTRSQCSCLSNGFELEFQAAWSTTHARSFWTRWSLLIFNFEVLHRSELQ